MNRFLSPVQRRTLIALIVTFALGVPLCLFGRAALLPFLTSRTVQSFWTDDLRDVDGVSRMEDTALSDEGITLSQVRRLPIEASGLAGFDSTGKLLGVAPFFAYDPAQGTFRSLRFSRVEGETSNYSWILGPDDRLYYISYSSQKGIGHRLSVYDPRTEKTHSLGVISTTHFLVAGNDGRVYGLGDSPWPLFVYDPRTDALSHLKPPAETHARIYTSSTLQSPIIGDDGLLYGSTRDHHSTYGVFALNLTSGEIVTHIIPLEVTALTPKPGGGAFFGTRKGLWSFDPASGRLAELQLPPEAKPLLVYALATRRDGRLVGFAYLSFAFNGLRLMFTYDPATGAFEWLKTGVDPDARHMIVGPDDRIYAVSKGQLSILESGQYTPIGSVRSEVIKPATLALTNTLVGGSSASVAALTCGRDDKLYGVKSDPTLNTWLFWHDPAMPEAGVTQAAPEVSPGELGSFLAGTAIAALDDGRLAGGTNSGHLFVYTPNTSETWDVGLPVSGTRQISALAAGSDGVIYGGTSSYGKAALFAFDPATGVITDVSLPFLQPQLVGALTVGKDGKVYAGVDDALVVYDPATQRAINLGTVDNSAPSCSLIALVTGADGKIYGGCGSRLFAYDPVGRTVSDLGSTQSPGYVASLTLGDDGRVYGSMEHEYMNRSGKYRTNQIFVYDPVVNEMTNLGMAISTGPVVLAACGEGTIYAGSNTTNSNYIGPAYLYIFRTDCPVGLVGTWDKVTWEADTPPGTRLIVDVLNPGLQRLVGNVQNGDSLQVLDAIAHREIVLRAQMYTVDGYATPVLKRWRVDYTFSCGLRIQPGMRPAPFSPLDWLKQLLEP